MLQKGTFLGGRYEILEHIGSGGMADVYKARCHKLNRYVAIKVLRREYCDNESFVRKFTVEAQSTAGLTHPNIVNIYDAGNEEGVHYIVMELAEGMTLKRYIRRYGRLSARETVDFAIQIASGLQAAHEHHIIHRDIKPQNILVSDSGTIKVTDFGIARAATGDDTISSSAMGSVRYLSPEQARGGYADERSDIYSLGITIYEMATGKVPFDGENTVAIALMHLRDEITPPRCYFPDIPASLEKIILKCTMKQPEQRYQSAAELILDLQKVFLSPDGSYVYVNPLVDDSPTIQRNKEDITKIRKSLNKSGNRRKEDSTKDRIRINEENEEDEDYKDDKEMNPKLEKMILLITVLFGVLVACVVFYFIGNSLHLFQPSSGTTARSRAAGPPFSARCRRSASSGTGSVPEACRNDVRQKPLRHSRPSSVPPESSDGRRAFRARPAACRPRSPSCGLRPEPARFRARECRSRRSGNRERAVWRDPPTLRATRDSRAAARASFRPGRCR